MPRKAYGGPAILKIEGLSTGIDYLLTDDRGEVMPQPNARPPKIDNAQAVIDANNRAKAEHAKQALIALNLGHRIPGYVAPEPQAKLVVPKVEGKRPIATITVGDKPMALYVPKPSWRRI